MVSSNLGDDSLWFKYVRNDYILWQEIACKFHESQETLHSLSGSHALPGNRKANKGPYFISKIKNFEDIFSMSVSHSLHPGFDHTFLANQNRNGKYLFFPLTPCWILPPVGSRDLIHIIL